LKNLHNSVQLEKKKSGFEPHQKTKMKRFEFSYFETRGREQTALSPDHSFSPCSGLLAWRRRVAAAGLVKK
jgi:hypothetical protein